MDAEGPDPTLLDTRGIVYLNLGQVDPALKDLEEAVRADPESPSRRLHLAMAYLAAGRREDASSALQQATRSGLEPARLDPIDRSAHDRLIAALAKK
jgi:Flp pilus assembly protein TadD